VCFIGRLRSAGPTTKCKDDQRDCPGEQYAKEN
jgi:hypothetical protein